MKFFLSYCLIFFCLYELPFCEHWQCFCLEYFSSNYWFLEALHVLIMFISLPYILPFFQVFLCFTLFFYHEFWCIQAFNFIPKNWPFHKFFLYLFSLKVLPHSRNWWIFTIISFIPLCFFKFYLMFMYLIHLELI